MSGFRKLLSWLFGISCIVCTPIALASLVRTVQWHDFPSFVRNALASGLFVGAAIVFGMACVAGWKAKVSAKGWGITASLLYVLIPLWSIIRLSRPMWSAYGFTLATGVAGVIAFSWHYEHAKAPEKDHEILRMPGDGTSDLVNRMEQYLNVIAILGVYLWWVRWLQTASVAEIYGRRYRLVLALFVILVITTLHEIGHVATGLAFGMRLRTFAVGPFQSIMQEGKWKFRFTLSGVLSPEGAAGIVPVTSDWNRWHYLSMLAGGPLLNLLAGALALRIALTAIPGAHGQARGLMALFGAWSLVLGAFNLVPFRNKDDYSDGAIILQLLLGGPWSDFRRTVAVTGSSLITPLRPRDYDIEAILRAGEAITIGREGLLLRLYAYTFYLDQGRTVEAAQTLRDAESIYDKSAPNIPADLITVFVFGNAYLLRNAAAARRWWTRMEIKSPTRFNVDYWMAKSALCWIEGNLHGADEAWQKSHALAQRLPNAGAYEFDRYCCRKLRQALDEVRIAG